MGDARIKRLFRVEAIDADDGHVRYRHDYQGSYAAWSRAHTLLSAYRDRDEKHTVQITRSEPIEFSADPEVMGGAS